jgi:hypothetical protein
MPAVKTSRSVIDNLPEVQRSKVVDALLAGQPLRKVAKLVGISAQQVGEYKTKVLLPAILTAQKVQALQGVTKPNAVRVAEQTSLTRDIVKSSPFRERVEKLWGVTDESIEKAKADGDIHLLAPLINQAHKNCEILGRATGELESVANNSVAIQIVYPASQPQTLQSLTEPAAYQTIDIALPKR